MLVAAEHVHMHDAEGEEVAVGQLEALVVVEAFTEEVPDVEETFEELGRIPLRIAKAWNSSKASVDGGFTANTIPISIC